MEYNALMIRRGSTAIIILVIVLLFTAVTGLFIYSNKNKVIVDPFLEEKVGITKSEKFEKQIKSLHFENSSPVHEEAFVGNPINIVINFNFDLNKPSEIKIEKDGIDFGDGETVIDESKLALRRKLNKDLPAGVYTVSYKACWPDESCHTGMFQFEIDSKEKAKYVDMTGKKEVEIDMDNITFNPGKIIISKGTKVAWVNKEPIAHYVNTDPHAGHNHYIYLNSKVLNLNDKYEYTFMELGEYPYHCSSHASNMIGRIMVE